MPRIPKGMSRIVAVFLLVAGAAYLVSSERPAYSTRDKAFYADPNLVNFVRPGLVTKITGATIGTDGTIKAQVKITDPKGLPLDRDGITTPGSVSISLIAGYIPPDQKGPDVNYKPYTTRVATSPITKVTVTQPGSDTGGTWAKISDGNYEYTFKAKATPIEPGATHSIGAYSSRDLSEFDLGRQYSDDVYTWLPAGGTPTVVDDVVKTATCNKCHNPLSAHGGSRQKVELCVMCHIDGAIDPDTGNTINFEVMVHKIHMGEHLPSVKAGTPYQIIGNAQSMHDFSNVAFPVSSVDAVNFPGVMNCTTCHDPNNGAKNTTNFLTPNRQACGACHDDVNFATGANHADLPQLTDNNCTACHQPQGDTPNDVSIMNAHQLPDLWAGRPGINIKILNVVGKAGEKPTVTFSVKDDSGTPIPLKDLQTTPNRLALVLGGPTTAYGSSNFGADVTTAGYMSEDVTRLGVCGSDGVCTYTFLHAIPADAKGTFAIGAEGRRGLTILPGTKREINTEYGAKNVVYYFSPNGEDVQHRQIVSIDKCNACHGELRLHGANRNQIEQCEMCHNSNETDVSRRPKDQAPAQSIYFPYMIHRIHTGEDSTREYTIYGFGGSKNDFSEVRFPGDRRDCNACHVNNSQQIDDPVWTANVKTPRGLTNPTSPITAACTGCHTSLAAASHALANTTQLGESCAACHGANSEFSVNRVHAR